MLRAKFLLACTILATLLVATSAYASDQTRIGEGNATAIAIAGKSPAVASAFAMLKSRVAKVRNVHAREATLDAIANPDTCVAHRAGLDAAAKSAIVRQLLDAGLLDSSDGANFPGGLEAGVFPPLRDDGTKCPRLPQRFDSAPGSSFGSHHSYPGGLAVHEAFNQTIGMSLARDYREFYSGVAIDDDLIIVPPMWHDWAKTFVYQWNSDGTEFQELPIGGNGKTDDFGANGNSKTGGHHILGLAEAMARAMPPEFVIAQACAHGTPVLGAEYKVVNWIHAASIIARVDPVARGYLRLDATQRQRLAAVRHTGDIGAEEKSADMIAEDAIHNLSDANFTIAQPSITSVNSALRALAPKFGYDPNDAATFNNSFRNPVMSALTAERLFFILTNEGMPGLEREVRALMQRGVVATPKN